MADRIPAPAAGGQPLQVHLVDSSEPLELKPVMGTGHHGAAQHSQHPHPQHAGHHEPHRAVPSDAARTGMHDGTMYAEGEVPARPRSLGSARHASRDRVLT